MNFIEGCAAHQGISRRQFLELILQLCVVAGLPSCRKSTHAFDGTATITPFVAEDHSRFLSHWAEQGVRDAVLINFDAHDDILRIADEKISRLNEIYNRRDWQSFSASDNTTSDQNGLFGIANWIYAGGKLGVFKEVYWVVPYQVSGLKESDLSQLLSNICFNSDDVATFSLKGNLFKGYINGIPFSLCSLDALPVLKKTVLLSIDVDFFPPYSSASKSSYVSALYKVFTSLYAQNYNVSHAAVCYSINGEYLAPHLRWVGDAVVQLFAKPDLFRNSSPPELLDLQQSLENAYRALDANEILMQSERYVSNNPDPSILVYRAFAYALKGDAENAHTTALQGCRENPLYCSVLSSLGTRYYAQKQFQIAERFYKSGFTVDPLMKVGLYQYGNCLNKLRKYQEALLVYTKDVNKNGSFPTEFLMAGVYIKLGNRLLAEKTLRSALKSLATSRAPSVQNEALAEAIYSIIDYCEQNGLSDMLNELRQHSMTKRMFIDFPKG